jgi:GNAT superfamily N-acetyltransferase
MPEINIVEADLNLKEHARDVITMTAAYAMDEMGNDGPLPDEVLKRLIPELRKHPTSLVFLAYSEGKVTGIATCFFGFSTFAARRLINIHDFAVLPEYRGQGIGRALLKAVEEKAYRNDCVKVTLEVQERNHRARHVYKAAGYAQALYSEGSGGSLFYEKVLQA